MNNTSMPKDISEFIYETTLYSCIPAGAMLVGSLGVLLTSGEINVVAQKCMLHLAAGIVMCAVATELCPILTATEGNKVHNLIGLVVGFSLGVALMLAMHELTHENEEDDKEPGLGDRQPSYGALQRASRIVRSNSLAEEEDLRSAFPASRVIAVAVDGALDGLLVGIASQASGLEGNGGIVMAVAISVEMLFVGITTAGSMRSSKGSLPLKVFVSIFLPLCIIAGGIGGAVVADSLQSHLPVYKGVVGFGTAALLFLVTEDLLLEAHEEGESHWWIDMFFFLGFIVTFAVDILSSP